MSYINKCIYSRTDFSRTDAESAHSSPPSRPASHAPWIYPSDIQIDPSSLEVSPRPDEEDEQRFPFGMRRGDIPRAAKNRYLSLFVHHVTYKYKVQCSALHIA